MTRDTIDPMPPIMRTATSKAQVVRLGYDVRRLDDSMDGQIGPEEIEQALALFQELS